MEYFNYLVEWLRDEVKKANQKGVIVGLSGGVDSSVVAAIAKKAFPDNSLGVYLPIEKMGQDLEDAKLLAKSINIKTQNIDLTKTYREIQNSVGVESKLALANMKPRLRMTALYSLAHEKNYLVLGTDNKAEWILGYFTKYGDGGVDLLPIIHLKKSEVMNLARDLKLPEIVYLKKPSAALWEGQTDEDELGFSYDDVDKYIDGILEDKAILEKIENQIRITNHKRIALPIPKNKNDFYKN